MIIRPPPSMEEDSKKVFTWDKPERLRLLSYVPMKRILEQMQFLELLDLSLMYEPAYSYLQSNKLKVLDFKWFIMKELNYVIHVVPLDQTQPTVIFRLGANPANSSIRFFEGETFQVGRVRQQFVVDVGVGQERSHVKRSLFLTLIRIMDVKHFHLKSTGDINLECEYVKRFSSFWLDGLELKAEWLKNAIGKDLEIGTLKLDNCTVITPTPIFMKLRPRVIELDNAVWLSEESFLQMECEKLTITPSRFALTAMDPVIGPAEFLEAWAGNGLMNLKDFKIRAAGDWEQRWSQVYRHTMDTHGILIVDRRVEANFRDYRMRVQRSDGQQAQIGFLDDDFIFHVELNQ